MWFAAFKLCSPTWSLTHCGRGATAVSKFGSQKNAHECLSRSPPVTTRCTVDLNTPFVHRSLGLAGHFSRNVVILYSNETRFN
jgi:hypothetical protein